MSIVHFDLFLRAEQKVQSNGCAVKTVGTHTYNALPFPPNCQ